jgi:hypothetical protein
MAFVQSQASQTIPTTIDYPIVAEWYINAGGGVPTQVQVENYSQDDIVVTSGLDPNVLGSAVTVAAGSTDLVTVTAVGDADFYVGAQGTQQDGQCKLTPGIEK